LNDIVSINKIRFTRDMMQYRLSAFIQASCTKKAIDVFRELTNDGGTIDSPFYSLLLDHLRSKITVKSYYRDLAYEILDHLKHKRIQDMRLYASIIYIVNDLSDPELSNHWIQRIPIENGDIRIITGFLELLSFSKFEHAYNFLEQVKEKFNIVPDERLCTVIIKCCKKFNVAYHFIKNMHSKFGVKPNAHHFSSVIKLVNHQDQVVQLISYMQENQVELNTILYTNIISSLCKRGLRNIGFNTFVTMKKQSKTNPAVKPDCYTMSILLHAFKDKKEIIDTLYRDCIELEIPLNLVVSRQLIFLCCNYREYIIHRLLTDDFNKRTPLQEELAPILLNILDRENDSRLELVKEKLFKMFSCLRSIKRGPILSTTNNES
jgi:hypothetical protein